MKRTYRDEWRVMVTIKPQKPAHLGLTGVAELAEFIAPTGPVTVAVLPRRLGDHGFISMSDSLASRDVDGDYRRRCNEIAAELRGLPHVAEATVTCTETHVCSHCGLGWEELTDEVIASHPNMTQDEHSAAGEPLCCDKAIDEFRAERKLPAVDWAGEPA